MEFPESKFSIDDIVYYYDYNHNELYQSKILSINLWDEYDGYIYDIVWKTYPSSMYVQSPEKFLFKSKDDFLNSIKEYTYEEFDDTILKENPTE